MKAEDARLASVVVGCVAVWMDTFAFADYGLLPVVLCMVQGAAVWSLLKLRRVDEEFFADDVVVYIVVTAALDGAYGLATFSNPTFSSAFAIMARGAQLALMTQLYPKTAAAQDRRPPYAHWLAVEFARETELPWRQELIHLFSFETRATREVPSIEI